MKDSINIQIIPLPIRYRRPIVKIDGSLVRGLSTHSQLSSWRKKRRPRKAFGHPVKR